VVGLADIAVALARQPALADAARDAAAALGLGLGVLAAVPVALVLAGAARLVRRRPPTRRTWLVLAISGAALATLVVLTRIDLGEVDWHGVDPWLPGSLALAAALYLALVLALTRVRRAAAALVVALATAAGVAAIAWFTAAAPQARGEALAAIDESSEITRRLAHTVARRLDADGDGHPRWLCGPSCDCDDADPAVHPLADDVADNAVDEDCDGEDRSGAELAALTAELTPPAPRAPVVAPPARTRPPNILLIVVDTLRADHLGTYGYSRATSPNIDEWAKTAVVFEQARATGPSTRFSVPPLMIGKYFTEIDRDKYEWPTISKQETLLLERLDPLGYTSGAFHSIRYLRPYYRLNQGFDHYSDKSLDVRGPPLNMTSSDFITDEALAWVDEARLGEHQPFFLWAYYGDPHSAYQRHPGFPVFSQQYRDLYDHEILFTDHHIGRLLDGLAERELTDDLIVVFTSDHGEALDREQDHGILNHSRNLYDELVRVPLIVSRAPASPPDACARPSR
jgi:choline-sulfatase